MKFQVTRGNKSLEDQMLCIKTDGWEVLSFHEIIRILKFCFENEDKLYPRPQFKGRGSLLNCILKIYTEPIDLASELETRKSKCKVQPSP